MVAGRRVQRTGQQTSPAAAAAVLVALGVVTVHLVGTRSFAHETLRSAAPEPHLPLWVGVGSAGCVLLGGYAAWLSRARRPGVAVGLAAAVVGAVLPAWASWTGAPPELRSAVLAAPALTAAGLAQVAPRWHPGGRGSLLGALAWVLALAAVAVHVLAYDPFVDPWCARVCRYTGGPLVEVGSSGVVTSVAGLLLLAVVLVGLAGVLVGSAAPWSVRATVAASIVAVGTLTAVELALRDTEPWARTTSAWLPWTLAPPALAVIVFGLLTAATMRAVDQLLQDLETGRASGVKFALPGEDRWVDASGHDTSPDGAAVVLYDEHGPAVRLAAASGAEASAGLTPSMHLALANARLTALTAARLDDVRAAQRRAVQRADDERHRIERDLHDGVQQTLVSAAFHLSAAVARGGATPEVDAAQSRVAAALAQLREVVHGVMPALLREEGIRAALDELVAASDSPARLVVEGAAEPPYEVLVAVYLGAVAIVGGAATEECCLELDLGALEVRLVGRSAADLSGCLPVDLMDRVGALGGTAAVAGDAEGWSVEVVLPCGS